MGYLGKVDCLSSTKRPLWFVKNGRVNVYPSVGDSPFGMINITIQVNLFANPLCDHPVLGCQVLISTLGESKETSTAVNQRVKAAEEAAVELAA